MALRLRGPDGQVGRHSPRLRRCGRRCVLRRDGVARRRAADQDARRRSHGQVEGASRHRGANFRHTSLLNRGRLTVWPHGQQRRPPSLLRRQGAACCVDASTAAGPGRLLREHHRPVRLGLGRPGRAAGCRHPRPAHVPLLLLLRARPTTPPAGRHRSRRDAPGRRGGVGEAGLHAAGNRPRCQCGGRGRRRREVRIENAELLPQLPLHCLLASGSLRLSALGIAPQRKELPQPRPLPRTVIRRRAGSPRRGQKCNLRRIVRIRAEGAGGERQLRSGCDVDHAESTPWLRSR
mmetsp:Transcript_65601/g.188770  ORF Transcript_65601/g.188770 Transcript_65601/m.188770 type:complete len:292 (+) Transcript_65601:1228-2103(+)